MEWDGKGRDRDGEGMVWRGGAMGKVGGGIRTEESKKKIRMN